MSREVLLGPGRSFDLICIAADGTLGKSLEGSSSLFSAQLAT